MVKKVIGAVLGVGLILFTNAPAFAAVSCGNFSTGPFSNNVCNTLLSKLHTFTLSNIGTVGHTIVQNSNSGYNTFNNNTATSANTTVNTGSSDVAVSSGVIANTASVAVNQTDPSADHLGANSLTGPSSNNTVTVSNTKTATVGISNNGNVTHVVTVNSNTGYNSTNNNTIAGGIKTGNATSSVFIQTILNNSSVVINQ